MKEKFAAFETDFGMLGDAFVVQQGINALLGKVFDGALGPDQAMLATRITKIGGIDHQRRNLPMPRKQPVVEHPTAPVKIIARFVHAGQRYGLRMEKRSSAKLIGN